jgi:membrane-bound lytic murein transglycosylase D
VKKLLFSLLLCIFLWGGSVAEEYPSYSYVLSEFDIDSSFVENKNFIRFVKKHEKQIKRFYSHSIKRGELLLPILQKKLMDDGLSDLLIYLSMVESGFKVDIKSPKKAVGLWQFMPATAKLYKLKVLEGIDERCDPQSATDAAIAHLQYLHHKFGKWYLAMMAYNCGEGRLEKAIKNLGTDTLSELIAYQSPLPKETKLYIQKILLAAMIGENIAIDFEKMPKEKTHSGLMRVYVRSGEKWSRIAELLDMSTEELKKINPMYKADQLPSCEAECGIYIPNEKVYAFYLRYDVVRHHKVIDAEYLLPYYVSLGDTLEKIAMQFHSKIAGIKRINHLKHEYLEVGRLLLIPVDKAFFDHYNSKGFE